MKFKDGDMVRCLSVPYSPFDIIVSVGDVCIVQDDESIDGKIFITPNGESWVLYSDQGRGINREDCFELVVPKTFEADPIPSDEPEKEPSEADKLYAFFKSSAHDVHSPWYRKPEDERQAS